ncbi:MAG: recombinase family protein, partial [Caldilineaceae bacterium]|nr:recombinase family protein [Caldilineaceae bacterium]
MNTYRVGVHRNTVKEWDRTRPGGQRFHTDEDVDRDCGRAPRSAPQRMAVHGRVSSRAQRPAREAQPRARETFRPGSGMAVDDGLTAIGGGWHGQRPVFRALMERIARRDRSRLRVAPKDRPCRCGLDGCAYCAETHDCAIRVV